MIYSTDAKNLQPWEVGMTIRETCPDTNLDTKLLELYTISSGLILDNADSWLEVLADVPEELATRVGALAAR